jgi:hypothetical protein
MELKFHFDFRFYKYVAPLALERTGAGGKWQNCSFLTTYNWI